MRRDSVKAPSKKRRRERHRSRPARPPRSHPVRESDALRTAEASESSCLPRVLSKAFEHRFCGGVLRAGGSECGICSIAAGDEGAA